VRVSASLGVSLYPADAADAPTLMEHADKAMYTAKQAGKNAYCLYSGGKLLVPTPPGESATNNSPANPQGPRAEQRPAPGDPRFGALPQ